MATSVARHTLDARGLVVRYGGVDALQQVSLQIATGEVVGLIGPNGAGKTTFLNAISGIVALSAGAVLLDGRALEGLSADRIARAGVVRTYQNVRLFRALSIEQNVRAGAFAARGAHDTRGLERVLERAALLDVDLAELAGRLPYGTARRVEIARALASEPCMLLLDEPAAGLNPQESSRLGALVRSIARDGIGILLVEHNMQLVSDVCDRVVVLNFGRVIAQGTPADVRREPAVIEAYLGTAR